MKILCLRKFSYYFLLINKKFINFQIYLFILMSSFFMLLQLFVCPEFPATICNFNSFFFFLFVYLDINNRNFVQAYYSKYG